MDPSENLNGENLLYFEVARGEDVRYLLILHQPLQEPSQLLELFKNLEAENLLLIQQCQQVSKTNKRDLLVTS